MEELEEGGFGREFGEQPPNFEETAKAISAFHILFGICLATKRWIVTI